MINKLKVVNEERPKKTFYASDPFKSDLDIYFGFIGEPKTNPIEWFTTLRLGAGNGVEAAMLKVLKDSGIVAQDYDQNTHGKIEVEREGVPISGRIDAITKEGEPIEIKSINNANVWDIRRYANDEPKENYVAQLAVYLDALNRSHGYLFVAGMDGINRFWFDCNRVGPRSYQCGKISVDLDVIYRNWANLYTNHVVPRQMPDVMEVLYKYDIETLDWKSQSKDSISKARNGNKVIGDWRVQYSPWKDKIVALQGTTLGYTVEELARIKELTQGYTTW